MRTRFTASVTAHGFTRVDETMSEIPDWVDLAKLPSLHFILTEIVIASQPMLDADLVQAYLTNPPAGTRVILRPYGDDIAVVDGHHTIAAARLRGDTMIFARWIDDEDQD